MKSRHRSSDIPESEAGLPKQRACTFLVTQAQIGRRHGYIMGLFFFSVLKAGEKNVFAAVKQLWQKVMGSTVTARRDSELLHLPALISVQE